jgi:hypothetical protein
MIAALSRIVDNLFGRGEAAVTVPPLDGPLRPNRELDEAASRMPLESVDCLVRHDGALLASADNGVFVLGPDKVWAALTTYPLPVACFASLGNGGLAIALTNGEILIEGGPFAGRRYRAGVQGGCITAIAGAGDQLYVANGSISNAAADWQRDLLQRNASGSIWRIDLASAASTQIAGGLGWPAGLMLDQAGLVVSEAWKHRLVRVEPRSSAKLEILHADLPAYPGRIAPAADGYWLALFAPRSQLVEYVLREAAYRKRMMAEVPQEFWVAPRLRSGRSFYESLQGGGVKHLGLLKPWAPTMSAGFCVKLDPAFQPRGSYQSRADGRTHGVTSVAEHGGNVFVAARGDGVVVSFPLAGFPESAGGPA